MLRAAFFSLLLFFLASYAAATYSRSASYEGQTIVRCYNVSRALYNTINAQPRLDIWSMRSNGEIDIRVTREDMETLEQLGLRCGVTVDSVEKLVLQFEQAMSASREQAEWFEEYHEYDDIVKWYEELASTYSDLISYVPTIGKSLEGRDMPAVHITANKDSSRFKIYSQCQIHAREWISGAVCGYIVNYLVENYGKDNEVTELLDTLEFVFIPFVNPDGYAYTWTGDRLWRKNRRPGTTCDGVDLNRNYNDHWNEGGSSNNPCSETYHGASASSEPETQNTENYFRENPDTIGAIDWHSFSQLILRPYGWSNTDCPDETRLKSIGDEMSSLIEQVHGKYYTSQKAIGLYPTSGTASDWFYSFDANSGNGGYRAAGFTIELRDTGQYGFILPPDQIIPNGEEMVSAFLYFAKNLLNDPLKME